LWAWYRDSASTRDGRTMSDSETMEEELERLRRENRELKPDFHNKSGFSQS